MKVFVGGSRNVRHLDQEVRERLRNITAKGGTVLVGDANGADKAIQQFLKDIAYPNVVVYFAGDAWRNNLGAWNTQNVQSNSSKRDFYFFASKDLAMSKEADYGFMLWDGKSKGTINNAANLLRAKKKVLIFQTKMKTFDSLREFDDLRNVLRKISTQIKEQIIRDLKIGELSDEIPQRTLL